MLSQKLTRKEQFVLVFLGGSIVFGAVVLWIVSQPSSAEPDVPPEPVAATKHPPATRVEPKPEPAPVRAESRPQRIVVSVAGAVQTPGTHDFTTEHRVQDAIDQADGLEAWADTSDINLAAHLIDGTTLTIPGEPEYDSNGRPIIRRESPPPPNPPQYTVSGWQPSVTTASASANDAPASPGGGPIDLNRASQSKLETLPGIGPKLAGEIIRFRETQPFQTVDDLDLVSGIGEKRLEAVRAMVTVSH